MIANLRQKAVFKDVTENKMPISTAMRKNGYSKHYAKQPTKFRKSEAWLELMEEYLPDYKLFKKHEEALDANKLHGTSDDFVEIPDHQTRLRAIELGYKLKGKMQDNARNSYQQINISLDNSGYVPSNNTLGLKPTKLTTKPKLDR